MSIFDNKTLQTAAKKLRDAEARYEKVWVDAHVKEGEQLDPDTFWAVMDVFVKIVQSRLNMVHFGESNASLLACDELFRQCATKEHDFTFDQLLGFGHTWDELSSELHRVLFDIVTGKGDDGYGDLCDSLPLAGRDAITVLLKPSENGIDHNNAVRGQIPDNFRRYIWDGENYFGMHLGDAAKKWFKIMSRDIKPKEKTFV